LERVLAHAAARRSTLAQAFEEAGTIEGVTPAAAAAGRDLYRLLATLNAETGLTLVARIERLLEAVGYRAEVERLYADPLERTRRWAAVEELLDFARRFGGKRKDASLATFLQALTLEEQDDDPDLEGERRAVTLMTLHSAKGLEFPRVYLVGLEEGLLPHRRSIGEGTVEEERRLMYVGITRAQHSLTLCHALARARFGRGEESLPSRFLFELKGEEPPKDWSKAVRAQKRSKGAGARGRAAPAGGARKGTRRARAR
jgi:DNA helicase-2/ATP-dependent DNA helicase PcrA